MTALQDDDDDDDILGIVSEPARQVHLTKPVETLDPRVGLNLTRVHLLKQGVTVQWLSAAFEMKPTDVRKRLARCPILRGSGRSEIYDLPVAAAFLVEPAISITEYLRTLKPDQLPQQLQESFWNAKLKQLKYMLAAGEAWRTTDVLKVLNDLFTTIKNQTQLWSDQINEEEELTPKQYKVVQELVNTLVDDIKTVTISKAQTGEHRSISAELDDVD